MRPFPAATRLVLVEDSPTQRAHLVRVLEAEGDLEVVAQVSDAETAVAAVAAHRPDAVTMDLDLPGSSGHDAIARIMAATPTPILVLSGVIDGTGAAPAVAALAAGAVDALPKPPRWDAAAERALRRHVRTVASVPVVGRRRRAERQPPPQRSDGTVVGIAASTGGPAALAALLRALPALPAPVLVVQHIHPSFATGFASWLDGEAPATVEPAAHGIRPVAGRVYVAPAERHLRLGARGMLELDAEPRTVHRPSADELFRSLAAHARRAAVGVVLTGMGEDGARGLLAIRDAGGRTFGQDESSSVVFGMPRAARELGAVSRLLPLAELAGAVASAVRELK